MKLKKHILSALAVALSLVLVFAFVACGGNKGPKVTAITLNPPTAEVETGDTVKLTASATYDDETTAELKAGDVTWTSDKPDVATVTRGIVSGKGKGTAVITATYGDFTATCSVTVNAVEVVIEGYTLNDDGKVDLELDATLTLTAKVLRNDVELPDEEIEWASSNAGLASVANGVVTAKNPGEVTITATRKAGVQSASVTVVIPEIAGAAKMTEAEQNKAPADAWGYWGDQGWNWSNTKIYNATTLPYTEGAADDGYERIGAGKMNITFSVDQYTGSMAPGAHDAAIQLFYRSSKEHDGSLEANHNYELKLTVLSDAVGTIVVNPFDDIDGRYSMDEEKEEDHRFELAANVPQEITVQFRHGDSGAIYKNGVYTNVESAINILLGLLSAPVDGEDHGNIVKVSVYDIQFKDLGESTYKWEDEPSELEGYVDPDAPVIPDKPTQIVAPDKVYATEVTLTVEGTGDEAKAILNLAGHVDLTEFESKEAAQTWLNGSYLDLQQCGGSWTVNQFSREVASLNDDGDFVIKYDITRLRPDTAGTGAYSMHFTEKDPGEGGYSDNIYRDVKLDADKAVADSYIIVGTKKYIIVNHKDFESTADNGWGQAYNWGCVSIKIENVTVGGGEVVEGND